MKWYLENIFGTSIFDTDNLAPPHYLVKNNKMHIENISREIADMTKAARERLTQLRLLTNERVNKARIKKEFKVNDYVFVLDRYNIPGNPRPLHTKLHPSPYIVIRPLWTTTLVKRLADGFTTLYSNDDLKLYKGGSPLFNDIPPEISKVLLHSFSELLDSDFTTITKYDNLSLPTGIQLYDPLSPEEEQLKIQNDPNNDDPPNNNTQIDQPDQLEDEFEPEHPDLQQTLENAQASLEDNDPQNMITTDAKTEFDPNDPEISHLIDQIDKDQLMQDLVELRQTSDKTVDHINNIHDHSDSDHSDDDHDPPPEEGMRLRSGRKKVHFKN